MNYDKPVNAGLKPLTILLYCLDGLFLFAKFPYDANGLTYWCEECNSGRQDLYTIATNGFMHSQEFYNRGLNDSDFVKTMYRTFFDREYDDAGYNDWMGRLSAGASRDEVIAGFAGSQEFRNLMASYGL